jgi:hypothetical protein
MYKPLCKPSNSVPHNKLRSAGIFCLSLMMLGASGVLGCRSAFADDTVDGNTLLKSKARKAFVDQLNNPTEKLNVGLSYWIELTRDNKSFRSNNKARFKTGDMIKFHILANADGFVYIVMKKGSSGAQTLLFPSAETGLNNEISAARDYVVPTTTALQFDAKPGVEDIALIFSRTRLDPKQYLDPTLLTCFVSQHEDGSKDLVPTRMQLSWDDPDPVIIPQNMLKTGAPQVVSFSGSSNVKLNVDPSRTELHATVLNDKSAVYVVNEKPDAILALEVALQHD